LLSNGIAPGALSYVESRELTDFLVACGRCVPFERWLESAEPALCDQAARAAAGRFLRALKKGGYA